MASNVRRSTRLTRTRGLQTVGDAEQQESETRVLKSKRAHETDSEDDFDEKPQKKRAKARPCAKKKDQSKAVALAKPRKRRGASLSMLVDQPLDIILTICQFITNPRDFVSLMQVNRAFYDLLSSHAMTTWMGMRTEFEIPDPIPGISEAEWAVLLLGEAKCEECGRRNKHHVNPIFMFKKRLCGPCLKNRTLKEAEIRREYWRIDDEITDLVPHMSIGAQRYNRYYSREEVAKVAKDLEVLESTSQEDQVAYMVSKETYCDEQNRLYWRAMDWLEDYRKREEDEICAIRAKAIQERFVELGYSNEDARIVSKLYSLREPKKLNDREWGLVKEKAVEAMTAYRITLVSKNPTGRVFAQRRELVREAYTQLKKSLGLGRWLCAPPLEAICKFPEVLKVLILPDDVVCTPEDFSGPLELYRSVIEEWSDGVCVSGGIHYDSINDIAKNAFGPGFAGDYPKMLDSHYYFPRYAKDCGKLAVYRFQCNKHPCDRLGHYGPKFTSLTVALGHNMCYLTGGASLECLPPKPWVVLQGPHYVHIQLLYLSGLEIATTTTDDMDNRGDFFKCLECAMSSDPERQAHSVATWRECIIKHRHAPEYEPDGVKFEIVHEEIQDVRQYWACARCNVHVDALVTRREVHKHLLDVHSVSDPSVPEDFLYAGPY